jgi:hypothetical protein
MTDEYLTVAELAARLKLAPKTVRNRMHDGTWPSVEAFAVARKAER